MLYLGDGFYFDYDLLIAFRVTGDKKRPSIVRDFKEDGEVEINGIKISVT